MASWVLVHRLGRIVAGLALLTSAASIPVDTANAQSLRVGTECTYYPFNYRDESGALLGFDVDVARALGERIGRTIEFVCQDWEDMIPSLGEQAYDMIAASMAITEKRSEVINFSVPYRAALGSFIAARGRSEALFAADGRPAGAAFADLRLGVLSHSVYDNWARERLPQVAVERHDRQEELYLALQNGTLDLVLTEPTEAYLRFLSTESGTAFGFAAPPFSDREHFGEGFGLGMPRNWGHLREEIDEAVLEMKADGTLAALSSRYFPFNIAPQSAP